MAKDIFWALVKKLVIISVACIFAFLCDAFDSHVTARITTRAVSTLGSRIVVRFFLY